MNNQVSFSWDIHYLCNYRCPYCWFYGSWHQRAKQNKNFSTDELLKGWINIYKKYGSVHIDIIGGEPFIYPDFKELIKELSKIHFIAVTTNLSVRVDDFVKDINSSHVNIAGTFHPLFANFDDFVKNVLTLRENNLYKHNQIWYLAYPPQIRLIPYYKEKFDRYGISLLAMSFWGEYNSISYPQGYTQEEKSIIKQYLGSREGEEFQLEMKEVRGKLCRAGQIYADIKADGSAYRCGGGGSYSQSMGNFFCDDFKLLDIPLPCEFEFCPCNEWAFLLVDEVKKNIEIETDKAQSLKLSSITESRFMEPKKEIDRSAIAPHRAFLTWDIHYGCNYKCTYCNTPKPWDPPGKWDRDRDKIVYPGSKKWLEIWQDIYARYGSCEIHITGGEPFVYPSFIELVKILSQIHTLEIITNLASDVNEIIKSVTPDRVRIGTTFHPEFADLREFLDKHITLRKNGFETWTNFVAYPPQLNKMAEYKEEFDKLHIPFNIQPFMGKFEERDYPSGYTDLEFSYLKDCYDSQDIINKKTVEWKTGTEYKKTAEKPCRMGQMYAKIYPNGDAYRCCANPSRKIGNLIDGTFKLLDEALPCECELCYCWRCMLVEKEKDWSQHWVVPEKKDYKL